MIRCFHCKRFLPPVPGSRFPEDPLPVSHACVITSGAHRGFGGKVYDRRVVPFVSPLTKENRVNAYMAEWDLP